MTDFAPRDPPYALKCGGSPSLGENAVAAGNSCFSRALDRSLGTRGDEGDAAREQR